MVLAVGGLAVRVQANMAIIRGGVSRGLSSAEINTLVRSTGQPGLRRTDLLQGIRSAKGIAESALQVRSVGRDRFPDPARIQQSVGPMLSNFSYEVRVRAFDSRAGKVVDRHITIRSDRNMTPRMIEEEAQRALEEAPDEAESGQLSEIESITLVGARRR